MIERIRKAKLIVSVYVIVLLVFNMLVFILFDADDKNFWCGYLLITVSIVALAVVSVMSYGDSNHNVPFFLNAPRILISGMHLVAQFVIGIMLIAIPDVSLRISLAIAIVIMAIYALLLLGLEAYKRKNLETQKQGDSDENL